MILESWKFIFSRHYNTLLGVVTASLCITGPGTWCPQKWCGRNTTVECQEVYGPNLPQNSKGNDYTAFGGFIDWKAGTTSTPDGATGFGFTAREVWHCTCEFSLALLAGLDGQQVLVPSFFYNVSSLSSYDDLFRRPWGAIAHHLLVGGFAPVSYLWLCKWVERNS